MKKLLLTCAACVLLAGCSSSSRPTLEQFTEFTGGQMMGDATSFYWVTEKLSGPQKASDFVLVGEYGWYQSEYRWDEGTLRELIRQGEQRDNKLGLVPYRIHVRFNVDGEAVYQQFRLNSKVLPIQADQLQRYQSEADMLVKKSKQQSRDGLELIQGYWDGETFETCTGEEFSTLEFNQTLPGFVINRLASVDSYVAFLGKKSSKRLEVDTLLLLDEDDRDCVTRPVLIEDEQK
ncbi:peptidylprolyl isomerase [Vibrio navarrensis]|uniref:DUF1481 domain-containing protein n=1 Tax=Vibrio navarrensis TaxID=29495 RepID=UPI00052BFEB1|nr:DUF1481 domain-containing protein [Vibrio navarrensis]KGK21964.1 peptidylprolyl isomerase [Vibrio navarrensis]MBE4586201.1 peptidylprolyl isomerase [Vibrio navarrensis]